ncbi:heavy-metal-associated domain-containing protein [Nonomuraea sp. SYSU D8015]|uniref:heavy-metal-associated domain-containing protein n=1 Tax=Nonomuraea sp. SYSU D8015 TaxID=2593644 RepID=UPI0016608FA8|nr:heavy metal-associated domain-containing protein [Nonomuraea sp. SYSU D8015]
MITVAYSLTAYRVSGLSPATCEHCLSAVKSELIRVPGVVGVDVTPARSQVSILTDGPVDESVLREAFAAAGCDMAGPSGADRAETPEG